MMSWSERVLCDRSLGTTARDLVNTIARFFSNNAAGHCSFFDVEAAGLIGVTSAQVREARQELERKHFLCPLHHPGGKPRYSLRHGYSVAGDKNDGVAAQGII